MTTRVKVDALNLTFPLDHLPSVRSFIGARLGEPQIRDKGLHTYAESARFEDGAMLAWSAGRPECLLSINGDSCDRLFAAGTLDILRALRELGGRVTRLDICADFSRDDLRMQDVHAAGLAGNVLGFRTYEGIRPQTMRHGGNVIKGDTAYFGSRGGDGSGRFFRIYDKFLESKGEIDATRLELEASGKVARSIFDYLLLARTEDELAKGLGETLSGGIDFVDKTGSHRHRSRMQRLPWWQKIVEILGRCEFKVPRVTVPLQRAMEYCVESWARNMALTFEIAESMGYDGDKVICELVRLQVRLGKDKLDQSPRVGARHLGLDVGRLLRVHDEQLPEGIPI